MLWKRRFRDIAPPSGGLMPARPRRAPAPRMRTVHDRTLVIRRGQRHGSGRFDRSSPKLLSRGLTWLLTSHEAYAGGLLLAWGLWGAWLSVACGAAWPA